MRVLHIEQIGAVPGYAPAWIYWLANRVGNSWHPLIFGDQCPACSQAAAVPVANLVGAITRRILWRCERYAEKRPAWVLAVLAV